MTRADAPPGDELLLRGGLIVDGSGHDPVVGDVLVRAGQLAAVGGRIDAPGARVVDADGLAVAPGFIDMHAHSDLAVLADGDHRAKVTQGVTTEVVGQDGLSYAPVTDETMAIVREQIAGWNGTLEGVDLAWRSVAGYLAEIDRRGSATNVAYLLPQGTIRMNVIGTGDRPASAADLAAMRAQVDQGMRAGAFGLSSGLTYVPGAFASTDELVALCEVVARHGGFYAPHQRSYGAGALDAYAEMVDVARRARCALHLTHATMNFPENRGRAGELLALVDRALSAGVDVTLDSYPYLPGSTTLSALLPSRAAVGGPEATLARLRDVGERAWIAHQVEVVGSDGCHGVPVDWATIEIAGVRDAALGDRVGRTVARIAADERRPPVEVFFDLLLADRLGTSILQHVGDEQNVREIMRHRRHTGGSDGILVGAKPHPRAAGTFPRYLGRYVREEGVLSLAEMIVHLAARPAERLGLHDRGRIAEGLVADVVVFDPATVADRATPDEPRLTAAGIPWVLVGGTPVIEDGERTGARPGGALRHSSRTR
ncbi:N-acyl-D-amino-acid deacylase family protein [Promicromonospora iranensis]|uniref:N-acyl-D-amino-acid deacylase family protein n=1 Tax=Promicromonospora iranensis TaxID=1105144 RepID=UPI0023A9A93E|nr:D-aminoacylase [Promicromonospora iranensis]